MYLQLSPAFRAQLVVVPEQTDECSVSEGVEARDVADARGQHEADEMEVAKPLLTLQSYN